MDTAVLVSFLQESIFVILVFVAFVFYAFVKGRQSITNLLLGLYLALLLTRTFPYFDLLYDKVESVRYESFITIGVFLLFTLFSTILFTRILPREYSERKFEGFGKKLLLATLATVLVMALSYQALPVSEITNLQSPIQQLFADESRFFIWLTLPLIALLF
ncbi:MAG: hypothetical protein WDZ68_01865, partial [Candidatus Paceibacterota bacterium]